MASKANTAPVNCIFCDSPVETLPSYGAADTYNCSMNCGNYLINYVSRSGVQQMLNDASLNIRHIIAGYLFNTREQREYSLFEKMGLSQEEITNRLLITVNHLYDILKKPEIPKTVGEKLDKLLLFLYRQTSTVGQEHIFKEIPTGVAYAKDFSELKAMLCELIKMEYGDVPNNRKSTDIIMLNHKGFERGHQLDTTNINSKRVFVAMQFSGPLLDGIRDNAIKPACAAYGFEAYTVDEEEHNEGIFDRIIVGIRTSKFVIADLTYKNAGAYFEAGYAQGLGSDVIRCCNQEWFDEYGVHFDLRHYNLIVWKDADDLKKRLMDRIGAMFTDTRIMKG